MEYDWPGNVRELQNVLERAMNLAWFETLEWKYFSDYFKHHAYETKTLNSAAPPRLLRQRTDELEKDILMQVLQEFHGNKTLVAQNWEFPAQSCIKNFISINFFKDSANRGVVQFYNTLCQEWRIFVFSILGIVFA